jgi:GrpB-like predicted nucleotidyltransferase (UPF0157 family)
VRVELVESDPSWPARGAEEAALVREALGAVVVEHIGSTAVPGLVAKPIIDLLAGLQPLDVASGVAAMEAVGYEYLGEYGIPGREFFRKGGDRRTHHVHAVELGGPQWVRHLAFRDYLRAHPDEAARYAAAKVEAMAAVDGDWESYWEAKEPVATDIEARALAWAAEN